MSKILNTKRKSILRDPVNEFKILVPDADNQKIKALTSLNQQYSELKERHKETQTLCKNISRQIGQAKREAQPVDNLLQSMKQQSSKTDELTTQLNIICDQILHFFESEEKSYQVVEQADTYHHERKHTRQHATRDQITIELLGDNNDDWNHYVESNTEISIYHRAEWKDLIEGVFGHECFYYYASNNGEIVGILPLVRLKSRLFGDFMVSMPFFNYGGPIANSLSIEHELIKTANTFAEDTGINHIEYRDDISRERLPVRTNKVNMILPLPATQNDFWNSINSKLRSQIRRAQQEETSISFGGEELVEDFYTVFARNMRDLGTPVYGKLFFRKILQYFTEQSKIVVIYMKNRPVAAAFLLGQQDTLEIPWASTIKDVNHLSMNMLLYWEVLKFAMDNHYRYFDFGRSSKDSGTFRFKQQWGARPKQLYWHYWLPENVELPKLNPDNPKYAMAINVWKKLPLSFTKWIGPVIVKNLP